MIGKTNLGGSGGGLNLTIKAHVAAPASTQSGRENEIWVVSGTDITHWAVKSTAPTAEDFGATTIPSGAVWIIGDGQSNEFDVLKNGKKIICIYPSACNQFIDGVWRNVEAYVFRSENWVQFGNVTFEIISNGALQNGLTASGPYAERVTYNSKSAFRIGDGNVTVQRVVTIPNIVCTSFSTLYIEIGYFGAWGSTYPWRISIGGVSQSGNTLYNPTTVSLDIKNLSGAQTLTFGVYNVNENPNSYVYNVYMK